MPDSGPLTQSQALSLLQRTSDNGWITSELAGPDGTAVINARTATLAAASQALMDQAARTTISDAPGGRPGVCTLTVTRQNGSASTVDLPAGYTFVTDEGIVLALAQPITIPLSGSPQSFDLPLQSVRQTELVNTYVPAFDSLLNPGDLMATAPDAPLIFDSAANPVLGPGATDTAFALRYSSSTPVTLGAADWLSAHGAERGQRRQPGEQTEEYRARIRIFPDAVSPQAIQVAVAGAAQQGALPDVFMVEPLVDQSSDAARAAIDLSYGDLFSFDGDYLDDSVGVDLPSKLPFRTLETASLREGRAYFREAVSGSLQEPDGLVFYLDDAGYFDDPVFGFPDVGQAPALTAALRGVQAECEAKRAGGVQFDIYVEDALVVHPGFTDSVGPHAGVKVWEQVAGPGTAYLLREGRATCTASGPIDPATDAYRVVVNLAAGGSIDTGYVTAEDGIGLRTYELQRLGYFGQAVASIEGWLNFTVSKPVEFFGDFWLTQVTL